MIITEQPSLNWAHSGNHTQTIILLCNTKSTWMICNFISIVFLVLFESLAYMDEFEFISLALDVSLGS